MEQFLELHPQYREANEHDLTIARINHEHSEREKMEQARQELLRHRQALIAENTKRKHNLANLDRDLERFIDVSVNLPLTGNVCFNTRRFLTRSMICAYRLRNQSREHLKRNIKFRLFSTKIWFILGFLVSEAGVTGRRIQISLGFKGIL